MPLPFSFSTQRQTPEAEIPEATLAMAVSEKVMSNAPRHVSTEPLPGASGNPFPLPVLEAAPRDVPNFPRSNPAHLLNSAVAPDPEDIVLAEVQLTAAVPPPSSPQVAVQAHDCPAQIEQLRNDIFGIAMNVSALNDRLDRMEQRLPQTGQTMQAGIATLRGEIENWLENHLNAAVEHCMHQIISRKNSAANCPVN